MCVNRFVDIKGLGEPCPGDLDWPVNYLEAPEVDRMANVGRILAKRITIISGRESNTLKVEKGQRY